MSACVSSSLRVESEEFFREETWLEVASGSDDRVSPEEDVHRRGPRLYKKRFLRQYPQSCCVRSPHSSQRQRSHLGDGTH